MQPGSPEVVLHNASRAGVSSHGLQSRSSPRRPPSLSWSHEQGARATRGAPSVRPAPMHVRVRQPRIHSAPTGEGRYGTCLE